TFFTLNGSGPINLGGADVRVLNGGTFSGPLSGTTGRLRITGLGTLTLTGGGTIPGLGAGPPPGQGFTGVSTLVITGQPVTLTSLTTDDTAALVVYQGAQVRVQSGGQLSFAPGATARLANASSTQPGLLVTGANSTVLGATANLALANGSLSVTNSA